MRRDAALIATGAVLVAVVAGSRYRPSKDQPGNAAWYASLRKPSYRIKGAANGAVYAVLDGLSIYAGARLIAAPPSPARTVAVTGWGAGVAGFFLYPWIMFGRHRLDGGLATVAGMIVGTVAAVVAGLLVDRKASAALVPMVAWLGFSAVLQEETLRRNT